MPPKRRDLSRSLRRQDVYAVAPLRPNRDGADHASRAPVGQFGAPVRPAPCACRIGALRMKACAYIEQTCMPRLPHLDRAVVPEAKILNYLLNARHAGGRAKAHFLEGLGFRAQEWHVLRDAIVAHATANDITASYQTRFGTRYEIDGPLPTPGGRAPIVRVVWFVESQGTIPRLVTLVPRRINVP
jgi:uncharacterized protein DUF6883